MVAKQRRGQDTVERLLEAALTVHAQHGVERFTLKAVLDASGVSVGSAYHHFGGLESLAVELYNRCMDDMLEPLCDVLGQTESARAGVERVAVTYLEWARDNRAKALVVHTLPFTGYFPAIVDQMHDGPTDRFVELVGWFNRRIEDGQIRPLPPQLLESIVIGPLSVAVHRWLSGVPGLDIDEAMTFIPESIWRSIAAE